MNDLSVEVRKAIDIVEKKIDQRENKYPDDNILTKIIGSRSALGDFGEELTKIVMKMSNRETEDHDAVCEKLGKVEIKTARLLGKTVWFNQIKLDKDWETLVIVAVSPEWIEAYSISKTKVSSWEHLTTNNHYTINTKLDILRNSKDLTKIYEGIY